MATAKVRSKFEVLIILLIPNTYNVLLQRLRSLKYLLEHCVFLLMYPLSFVVNATTTKTVNFYSMHSYRLYVFLRIKHTLIRMISMLTLYAYSLQHVLKNHLSAVSINESEYIVKFQYCLLTSI